jgi:hypothetical protein
MGETKRYFPDSVGTETLPHISSASNVLTLPSPNSRPLKERVVCFVDSTEDITSIVATGEAGTEVILIFTDTAAVAGVVDGGNLNLTGDFAFSPDATLRLVCDGTNFYQLSSSAN